jgi:hypothetical protein
MDGFRKQNAVPKWFPYQENEHDRSRRMTAKRRKVVF